MDGATFTADVTDWVRKTQARMLAVFRLSAEYVIEDALARTPRDTGFLAASMTVTLDGPLPIREGARPAGDGGYQVQPYSLVIAGADLGGTIHASWVASYAIHVEMGARGRAPVRMVGLAAQNWQSHVNRAVAEAKARVG